MSIFRIRLDSDMSHSRSHQGEHKNDEHYIFAFLIYNAFLLIYMDGPTQQQQHKNVIFLTKLCNNEVDHILLEIDVLWKNMRSIIITKLPPVFIVLMMLMLLLLLRREHLGFKEEKERKNLLYVIV